MSFELTRNPRGVQVPYCEMTQSATSINNATGTVPNLTSTTQDNGAATCGSALADLANDRLYLRRAGIWGITLFVNWASNATGYREIELLLNGLMVAGQVNSTFGTINYALITLHHFQYTANTTDYVSPLIYQNSGAGLNATATLKATWLGPS